MFIEAFLIQNPHSFVRPFLINFIGKIVHHDHENGTIVLNHIDTKNQGFRLDFT